MTETDLIVVGNPLPVLASVEATGESHTVRATWSVGGRVGRADVIDLAPMILTFKVLRPLRDDAALFGTVRLGDDGRTIAWGDDPDLEIGADSLEEMAEETMTSADLAAFMTRHGLSYDATAAHLGISRRLVAYYLKTLAIPRTVALACKYLDGLWVGRKLPRRTAASASPG